jgi:hypothetical protein
MSYYEKYLKYKTKYLELKNQIGGGDKFIDAIKEHNYLLVERKLTEKHGLINAHYADCNQMECKTGYTPFMIAWNNKDIQMGELLIKYGADVNLINIHTKQTPLEEAITLIADAKYTWWNDEIDIISEFLKANKDGIVELLKWVEIIMSSGGTLKLAYIKSKIQLDILMKGLKKIQNLIKTAEIYRTYSIHGYDFTGTVPEKREIKFNFNEIHKKIIQEGIFYLEEKMRSY